MRTFAYPYSLVHTIRHCHWQKPSFRRHLRPHSPFTHRTNRHAIDDHHHTAAFDMSEHHTFTPSDPLYAEQMERIRGEEEHWVDFFVLRCVLRSQSLSYSYRSNPSLSSYFLARPSGSRLTNQHHLTVCFLGRYRMGNINQSASSFGLASWILLQKAAKKARAS